MSTANRVIKNTGYLYAKMGITMFISLYTTRLVLSALGASDYGVYNVVGGSIAMLGFMNAAMSTATQRFMSFYEGKGDKEKLKYVFNVSTVLHYGIALLLVLGLIIVGYFFFNGVLNIPEDRIFAAKIIYCSLLVSTAFTVISVPYQAVLNAHENMFYYSVVGVVESFLKLATALIVLSHDGDRLILYGILMALIPFISRVAMQVYCRRKYVECVIAPRRYWDGIIMKELASFAGWDFFRTASRMLSIQGMSLVLNGFFGVIVNAAQGVANQLSGQFSVFSSTMLKALNPLIVKNQAAQQKESFIKATITGSKMSFLLFAFFSIPFIVEAHFVLKLWLGEIPEYTISFSRLILLVVSIRQLTVTFVTAIGATGKIKQISVLETVLIVILLPISILAFKLGAQVQFIYVLLMIVEILIGATRVYYANKLCEIPYSAFFKGLFFRAIVTYTLTVAAGYLVSASMEEGFVRFILTGISCVITFFIASYFICFTKEEVGYFKSMFISLIKKIKK